MIVPGFMRPALRYSLLALAAALLAASGVWLARPDPVPPPGLFAAYASPGRQILAEPGPGFHYLESNANHRWAWSAGEATILLRGRGPAQPVRLCFDLQSLAPRSVTVSTGGFILWRGQLSQNKATVDIPSFTLTGPEAVLTLSSDRPGDSKPGDGRQLAFAVYDLKISAAE